MQGDSVLASIYASFLGKVIGVRLGAPVENWSAVRIAAQYPDLDGYPVDYGVFAADDDTNGPAFFVRAIEDVRNGTPLDLAVANAMQNYIPDHSGFFWWGGTGVSTEQTAYENLSCGLRPPASGSAGQNGRTLAEQIGGQIFSDCWGYLAPCDPAGAAQMAAAAASVTHDGEGIQGARFIAAAIAAAMGETTIPPVLDAALRQLDPESEYAKMVCAVRTFALQHPNSWRACLTFIDSQYPSSRYGGACHILPNAARIVMALCYGHTDFNQTLLLCCRSGFDTDCNCGNIGSIMGALKGLPGIPARWITPINDVLILSSCLGYENNATVSGSARRFAAYAQARSIGAPIALDLDKEWCFRLPYETKGALASNGRLFQSDSALSFSPVAQEAIIFWRAYFRPEDLYDARYEPTLAPRLFPGETVRFLVSADGLLTCLSFAETDGGTVYGVPQTVQAQTSLVLTIPAGGQTVLRFGVLVKNGEGHMLHVHAVSFDYQAEYRPIFSTLPLDDYGERFMGGRHRTLRGLSVHSGNWQTEGGGLIGISRSEALLTLGSARWQVKRLGISLSAASGCSCFLLFSVQGARRFFACGIRDGRLLVWKRQDDLNTVLLSRPLMNAPACTLHCTLLFLPDELHIEANGTKYQFARSTPPVGAIGLLVQGAGQGAFRDLFVEA